MHVLSYSNQDLALNPYSTLSRTRIQTNGSNKWFLLFIIQLCDATPSLYRGRDDERTGIKFHRVAPPAVLDGITQQHQAIVSYIPKTIPVHLVTLLHQLFHQFPSLLHVWDDLSPLPLPAHPRQIRFTSLRYHPAVLILPMLQHVSGAT